VVANRKNGWTAALRFWRARVDFDMEEFADIQCPFCGQTFAVAIDTSLASQRFTTDCEVCCRPFEVMAECSGGNILDAQSVAG